MQAMNQSNIADQLSALSREEDEFRKATAKADRERTMIEARLRELRGQQKELSKETRAASDAVGVYQKERGMLLQQKERLQQQLKMERGELEQCAQETKQLVTQETAAKKKFCETMEDLNDELSDLLMQQEELRVQKMIGSPDTIADLTEHLEAKPEADPEEQKKALEALVEANTNYEKALAESKQLTSTIKDLRARALAEAHRKGQELTEDSFLQMEAGWAEQEDENTEPGQQGVPLHLQIFYNGNPNEESQDSTAQGQ